MFFLRKNLLFLDFLTNASGILDNITQSKYLISRIPKLIVLRQALRSTRTYKFILQKVFTKKFISLLDISQFFID
jgi:hypothetical protein